MPALEDPNFSRSVTLLCQHNAEGAMGLVLNRAADLTLGELLEQMQISTQDASLAATPVLLGGPVNTERGFVLHTPAADYHSSMHLADGLVLTTSRDVLEAMAIGAGPEHALVALGYAGWSAGQLEQELLDNAWLTSPAPQQLLFHTPLEQRWAQAVALAGVDPLRLSRFAGHA